MLEITILFLGGLRPPNPQTLSSTKSYMMTVLLTYSNIFMYKKDICGFSFVNYGGELSSHTKLHGGLGSEAFQPPEAEIF